MSWFTKSETIETVIKPCPTPLEQYQQNRSELRALDKELAEAEKAIKQHIGPNNKDPRIAFLNRGGGNLTMYTRLNAMFLDSTLQKLEWNRGEILRKRAAKLAEHARLKKECGLGNF